MAGTKAGGQKARDTNYERNGKDFYGRIGAIGGKKTGMKGFALDHERARIAGKKGGTVSRRGKVAR